jgi:hypothetical protein
MKKILFATNLLLLLIILVMSCQTSTTEKKPADLQMGEKDLSDCLPDILQVDYDTIYDQGSMDALLAKALSESFAADPYKSILSMPGAFPGRTKLQDTRSIWFDLGRLKNLIATIEGSVCERDCKRPIRLGVRIYLAKYPAVTGPDAKDMHLKHIPAMYANRTTAFMVGTYDNYKGKHIDFDPMNVGPDKCNPITFARLLDSLGGKKELSVNGLRVPKNVNYKLDDTTAMNQGDLMPPPSGKGTFPTSDN